MTTIAFSDRWSLQDAKNRFSEVVRQVFARGPQMVTKGGQDTVVIVSAADYERLTSKPGSLLAFLQESPLANVELDFNRPKDTGRPVEF